MTTIHPNTQIGFIGAGNMGEAIIGALLKAQLFSPPQIKINDISRKRLEQLQSVYQTGIINDNARLFAECDIIIMAVKPQQMGDILSEISGCALYADSLKVKRKLVISIAAGTTISKIEGFLYSPLEDSLHQHLPIVRVMPNTPALVLAGTSGMSPNAHAAPEDIRTARSILESMGRVVEFEESALDAVTGLSGSGPAYIFYLIEAMTQAGIEAGLKPEDAAVLTVGTVDGAVKLLMTRNEAPEELRRKVTSPGGTTEAAIKVLDDSKVKNHIINAVLAATQRSKELSQ